MKFFGIERANRGNERQIMLRVFSLPLICRIANPCGVTMGGG